MITVSNTAAVTLAPGQALTFNDIVWKSGCGEAFRNLTSAVFAAQGVYDIAFSGNVAATTGGDALQLNIAVDGVTLPETTMISTPATADIFNNVSTGTTIGNRGSCFNPNPGSVSITVVNTGTTTVTVGANARLSVKRVAGM